MKIQVVTDDGMVVDSYVNVWQDDIDSVVFGPAIRDWLKKTLRKAAEMNKPVVDDLDEDFPIHAADRTMRAQQLEKKTEPECYTFSQLRSMGQTELFGVFATGYLDEFPYPDPRHYASAYQAFQRLDELERARTTEAFKMVAPVRT